MNDFLTCGHPVQHFVGPPAQWGRCKKCGKIAHQRVPGRRQRASVVDIEKASKIRLDLLNPEPGSGPSPDKPLKSVHEFPRGVYIDESETPLPPDPTKGEPVPERLPTPTPTTEDGILKIPLERDGFILQGYNLSYRRKEPSP